MTPPDQDPSLHNTEELRTMLTSMNAACNWFYKMATTIGCHPFIEFTGLMREYIKCCETAHAQGIDFAMCSTHTGQQLPMPPYSVDYINEKLECIFTGLVSLRDPMANPMPPVYSKSVVHRLATQMGMAYRGPANVSPCQGDPGECAHNGACMYGCGSTPPAAGAPTTGGTTP